MTGTFDHGIQWTLKDDVAVLWDFDPEVGRALEILQIREK